MRRVESREAGSLTLSEDMSCRAKCMIYNIFECVGQWCLLQSKKCLWQAGWGMLTEYVSNCTWGVGRVLSMEAGTVRLADDVTYRAESVWLTNYLLVYVNAITRVRYANRVISICTQDVKRTKDSIFGDYSGLKLSFYYTRN